MIEANRIDGWYRPRRLSGPVGGEAAHRVLRIFEYFADIQWPASITEIGAPPQLSAVQHLGAFEITARPRLSRLRPDGADLPRRGFRSSAAGSATAKPAISSRSPKRCTKRRGLKTSSPTPSSSIASTSASSRHHVGAVLSQAGGRGCCPPPRRTCAPEPDGRQRCTAHLLRINAEGLSTPPLRFSDLKPALDTIRCQGFAYTRGIGTPGLSTMAMPLTAAGQGPALASPWRGRARWSRRRRAPSCAPCAT